MNMLIDVQIIELSYGWLYLSYFKYHSVRKVYMIAFFKRLIRLMTRLLFLFIVTVKENYDCASYLSMLITITRVRYLFSSTLIFKYKSSKCRPSRSYNTCNLSLCVVFSARYDKTKSIPNPFQLSIYNNWFTFIVACVLGLVPLFDHVCTIEMSQV